MTTKTDRCGETYHDPEFQATRQAANDETITRNTPRVLALQTKRIAALEAELAALRAVAVAADNAYDYYWRRGMDVANDQVMIAMWWQLEIARSAGYLPTAEGETK